MYRDRGERNIYMWDKKNVYDIIYSFKILSATDVISNYTNIWIKPSITSAAQESFDHNACT